MLRSDELADPARGTSLAPSSDMDWSSRPATGAARHATRTLAVLAGLAWLTSCGGSGANGAATPTAPSPPAGGTPAPMSATITIGTGGVSPSAVTIARGGRVTFVNSDSRFHEIASDPHPNHTDCPPVNDLGTLAPGGTGMTGAFDTARRCGFHDHLNPDDATLRGSITIQ